MLLFAGWPVLLSCRGSVAVGSMPIAGVAEAEATGALVFHAGTAVQNGQLVTNGGRILNVIGCGDTVAAARAAAYDAVGKISYPGMRFRRDIAASADG